MREMMDTSSAVRAEIEALVRDAELTETQKTKAELWDLAVGKGLITVHSEQLAPGTWSAHLSVASWMEGHDKACDISNQAYDAARQEKQP